MEHERIIYILNYLSNYTSEKKKVTLRDIQEHLANEANLRDVSILTLRRDMARLMTVGYDIRRENGAHNTAYYYLVKQGFTFNEIRFIVDSISINKFLSNTLKQRLIKKFEVLCSGEEVRQLISRISLNSQAPPNLNLLENLEKVHLIISQRRKINFDYGKYDIHKQMQYYHKHRDMIPCKVIYSNERFYLKCMDEETKEIRTYRIDRMQRIKPGDKTKVKAVLPKRQGAVLDIFEPEQYLFVTFRVKRHLLDDMLEQFGSYACMQDDDNYPDYVLVKVKIGISQSFYRWVMRYGANMEIIAPESIRQQFQTELAAVMKLYEKS